MNFLQIQTEVNRFLRTSGLDEYEDVVKDWVNIAWERLCAAFKIPALQKEASIDITADTADYCLPLDYDGADIAFKYQGKRRLDPVPQEDLELRFERGSTGLVRYYDLIGCVGSDTAAIAACTLVNKSASVSSTTTHTSLNLASWLRFEPDTVGNPGDYPYQIVAGTLAGAGPYTFTLSKAYRGASGTYPARVRPAETPQVRLYATPSESGTGDLEIIYQARPRRLYNSEDVPEVPGVSDALVHMTVAVGLEFVNRYEDAKAWWGRAMGRMNTMQARRMSNRTLVTDLPIGSIAGRTTGLMGVGGLRLGRGLVGG